MREKRIETPDPPEFARLRTMSTSPYPPEPPRKSRVVNLAMKIAKFANRGASYSPHLFGGNHLSKVEYEYSSARQFMDEMSDYIDQNRFDGKDVLDAGCGWGGKTVYFAEHTRLKSIRGFDLPGVFSPEVPESFARARSVTNCYFTTGYAEEMPYDNESFDILIMEDVLEHVSSPEKVVSESYRVLRPDGTAIIKFPSFRMMCAHHLDRALSLPGLHYIVSMKTWASGLNDLLLQPGSDLSYEPFDEVVSTEYAQGVTRNLNGLDYAGFCKIVRRSGFEVCILECVRHGSKRNLNRNPLKCAYHFVYDTGVFR